VGAIIFRQNKDTWLKEMTKGIKTFPWVRRDKVSTVVNSILIFSFPHLVQDPIKVAGKSFPLFPLNMTFER